MKVLYFVSGLGPPAGWGTEYIQDLIFHLSKNGVQATIINPILLHTHPDWKKWTKKMEKKYNVKFININPPFLVKQNFYLYLFILPFLLTPIALYQLSTQKYDLIHEFSSTPVILIRAIILKLLFGTPTVFTHSVYNNTFIGNFFWFRIFNFAKFYVVQSAEISKKLKKIGIDKSKINLIYPGIDTSRFKTNKNKIFSRKQLKLPNKFIFSYFGSLTEEKGINDLLKACTYIDQKTANSILVCLYIIWKGSSKHQKFEERTKTLKLNFLKLIKSYVDIPTLLEASDVVVLPQRTGMGTTIPPISVLEALIVKKKIIAAEIIGLKEWTKNTNLILVPPKNPKLLSKAMVKLFNVALDKNFKYTNFSKIDLGYTTNQYHKLYTKTLL